MKAKLRKILFLWLLFALFAGKVFAQKRLYSSAYKYYLEKKYHKAWILCGKGIAKYPKYKDFYLLSAKILYQLGQKPVAIPYLKKYYELSNDVKALREIGLIFFDVKLYDSAVVYLNKAQAIDSSAQIEHYLQTAQFRVWAYRHPVPFNPHGLPSSINTRYNEYFPDITAKNDLYFTRLVTNENLFVTRKIGPNSWSEPRPLPPEINTDQQEGACTVSADGKMMIFTRCIARYGCDLYVSFRKDTTWTKPQRLPRPINTQYWESQPCLANNGHTLYFVSNRPGGKGDMDIWAVDYVGGKWQHLRNLGDSINTPGREMSPFLHFDGRTLYFASNYHPGLGGYDLFLSRYEKGHWTKPVNLGYPINSEKDDVRLIVNVTGDTAYFSSAKEGNQNLYYFRLYSKIRPLPTVYISGTVVDGITGKPLRANVSLYDLENDSLIYKANASEFLITAKFGTYGLYAERQGYMFNSRNFTVSDTSGKKIFSVKIKLYPIAQGLTVVLPNIFFDFNSYTLKPQSKTELEKLVHFLKENNTVKIEIDGHTDSVGTYEYNMELSLKRAQAIKQYLVQQGIDPSRLIAKGFGYTRPRASNRTAQGRRLNRRVEIKILKL